MLRYFFGPLLRVVAALAEPDSVWERVAMPVPASAFGPGSTRPFTAYFEGESRVRVASIDEIVAWLQSCEYVSDLELFHERDVWQHPAAFETRRRGDCEDFALWTWRKLAELGIDAELCVGRVVSADQVNDRQHAWVMYRAGEASYLVEPAARTAATMIRPLDEVKDLYVPHFAVNHRFETNAFAGCAADAHREPAGDPGRTLAV